MTYEANGARFIAKDDMIVRWCRETGQPFEPETTEFIFGATGTFVDVGASTGWFSIPMALRGHKVEAFEPNPAVFRRLSDNADLNGAVIAMHHAAASDKGDSVTMWINPAVPLTSGGSIERATCARPKRIEVQAVRLDDALSGDVSLIKIDVEGHEMAVLRGAEKTVERCRPHLVLEANTPDHCAALALWLDAHGYSWRRADHRNMLCSPSS